MDPEALDFAVAVWREEGAWQADALPARTTDSLDALVSALRAQPGEEGVLGFVSIAEDFFLAVRILGDDSRFLLSDVDGGARLAARARGGGADGPADARGRRAGRRDDRRATCGSSTTWGSGTDELDLLCGDLDLYPDEMLASVATADRLRRAVRRDPRVAARLAPDPKGARVQVRDEDVARYAAPCASRRRPRRPARCRSGRSFSHPTGRCSAAAATTGRRRTTTAHAEVLAIRRAAAARSDWRLTGCTLAVTLEPCPMCAGAAWLARVDRVVFGAWNPSYGAAGSVWDLLRDGRLDRRTEVVAGVLAEECAAVVGDFFDARR